MNRSSSRVARVRAALLVGLVTAFVAACGGSADEGDDCVRAGVYSRGKEGGPSCCAGFEELGRLVLVNQGTAEERCEEPPGHAAFGCIEGECGDGRCEPGEQGPCGCDLDCSPE